MRDDKLWLASDGETNLEWRTTSGCASRMLAVRIVLCKILLYSINSNHLIRMNILAYSNVRAKNCR